MPESFQGASQGNNIIEQNFTIKNNNLSGEVQNDHEEAQTSQ